jgi:cell division protease FtsH
VAVDLPDVRGRLEILKVHSKGKPLAEDVRLELIAQRTMGFSGASLANLLNEAAIVAARHSHANITYADLDYALDRLTVGQQKSTGMAFKERQKLVAYHEAGHAIVGSLIPGYDLVTKVTIVPRSNGAGGFTLFTPSEERLETGMMSKSYLEAQLTVMLGGRVAEELIFGPAGITTGASNDLQQVRSIARRMITEWGYGGDQLGATAWESPDGGRMSQATEEAIDQEVMKLVGKAYKKCKSMLRKNRRLLDDLAEKLLEKETVDFVELYKMVGRYHPAIAKAQQANFPPDLRALKAA